MTIKYITIDDLAKALSVSVSTIRLWLKKDIIPKSSFIKVGSIYRFNSDDVVKNLKKLNLNDNEKEVSKRDFKQKIINTKSTWNIIEINLLKKLRNEGVNFDAIAIELKFGRGKVIKKGLSLDLVGGFIEDSNHKINQFSLGRNFEYGIHGEQVDYSKAYKNYKLSAEQGYAIAQYSLGECYDFGNGTLENKKQAFKYYKLSSEQGLAIAQYKVGCFYILGEGTKKNLKKGFNYFQLSAAQGNIDAHCSLGLCYHLGHGTEMNSEKCFKHFQISAQEGDQVAQYWLGACYLTGKGTIENEKNAIKFFKLSAEQGYADSQIILDKLKKI